MKKMLIPAAGILLGIISGVTWHFVSSANRESFVPYRVGKKVDEFAGKASEDESYPDAKVDGDGEIDAGSIETNRVYEQEVVVENKGKGPLYMRFVKSDPGIQVAEFDETGSFKIAAESSYPLRVRWMVRDPENADFSGSALIATNDPYLSKLVLKVSGTVEVKSDARATGEPVMSWQQSDSREFGFDVVSFVDKPFAIKSHRFRIPAMADFFEFENSPLTAEQLKAITNRKGSEAKSGYHVSIKTKPGMPIGMIYQSLILETDIGDATNFELPVFGLVNGSVLAQCQSVDYDQKRTLIDFGTVKPGEAANEAEMSLAFRDGTQPPKELKLLDDQCAPNKFFQAIFERPTKESDRLTVVKFKLIINPSVQRRNFAGTDKDSFARVVIGDESGKPVAVLNAKVIFEGSK